MCLRHTLSADQCPERITAIEYENLRTSCWPAVTTVRITSICIYLQDSQTAADWPFTPITRSQGKSSRVSRYLRLWQVDGSNLTSTQRTGLEGGMRSKPFVFFCLFLNDSLPSDMSHSLVELGKQNFSCVVGY